ncbi:HAD family phosphatase [Nocardioides marmoriginsengisoli]|uniref:HAD family phosphatase n=1 Tax=Nocardioides marmoriginsengisoli TaxID=661483 RepID=A0A3N0CF39_9ACTN|nr:HAD family hydrolase [Nocardioides marmoriginsengisoli]RNL62065.1 HAD family phosphatase [Nocardioides marmoriginsengisoli]
MSKPGEPGWVPALVALDIDGTLLIPDLENGFSSEVVTDAVTEAVLAAARSGAHVVLASGRAPLSMAGVADRLGLTDLVREVRSDRLHVVASNGSVVVRYAPLEMVHEVTFDASAAVRTVLEHVPGAAVAVEEHGVGYRVNRLFPPGELDGEMIICDIDEMIAGPVSRVIIRDPDSTSEDFVNLAKQLGLHGTNYFIGWTAWLDLAPEGVSKASGLEWVCRELGIDAADVLAIGDGRNDIEMLTWAGRGVAMGQGPQVVRDAADHVTAPVDEDGAAVELRRWFR